MVRPSTFISFRTPFGVAPEFKSRVDTMRNTTISQTLMRTQNKTQLRWHTLSLPPSLLTASTKASWSSGVQRIRGLVWAAEDCGLAKRQVSPDGIECSRWTWGWWAEISVDGSITWYTVQSKITILKGKKTIVKLSWWFTTIHGHFETCQLPKAHHEHGSRCVGCYEACTWVWNVLTTHAQGILLYNCKL